ncbi:hypothetical protein [Desulfovibrio desulfuricans]|uniref:hypothetical protein n=1 Tax=Desulfovibrio desulfuricans TaxID=876 RepID=UPI003983F735
MTRHYFSQPIDVKPTAAVSAVQRITLYRVNIAGKRHDVPTTHRGILFILRLMMRQNSQNAEANNG